MKKILILFVFSIAVSLDLNVSSSLKSGYCSSYDFYDYSENLLDVNLFSNNLFFWTQYESSNPPEIGFPLNDFRKFRIEYSTEKYDHKRGFTTLTAEVEIPYENFIKVKPFISGWTVSVETDNGILTFDA